MTIFEEKSWDYLYSKYLIFGYFWRKSIELTLSKMVDFWLFVRKFVALPLYEKDVFCLFLKKKHRITSIENDCFFDCSWRNSIGYLYRKCLIFGQFWRKFIGLPLSEKSVFCSFLKKKHMVTLIENVWRNFMGLPCRKVLVDEK